MAEPGLYFETYRKKRPIVALLVRSNECCTKQFRIAKSVELSPVLPSLCYLNFSRYHSCFTGCREEPPSFPFFRQSNQIILSPPSAIISRYGVTGSLYNLRVTGCMSRRTRHIHKVLIIRMYALFQYYIVLDYSSLPPPPRRYRGLE